MVRQLYTLSILYRNKKSPGFVVQLINVASHSLSSISEDGCGRKLKLSTEIDVIKTERSFIIHNKVSSSSMILESMPFSSFCSVILIKHYQLFSASFLLVTRWLPKLHKDTIIANGKRDHLFFYCIIFKQRKSFPEVLKSNFHKSHWPEMSTMYRCP